MGSVAALAADPAPPGPDERERWARIVAPLRRAQFLAGRRLAQALLARWSPGTGADAWRIEAGPDGRPWARSPGGGADRLYLSISHSGDRVAVAVSDAPVGLDVEAWPPRRARDVTGLVEATIGAAERATWPDGDAPALALAFHRSWVLKEAWLKSRGEPVSVGRLRRLSLRRARPGDPLRGRCWAGTDAIVGLFTPAAAQLTVVGPVPAGPPTEWAIDEEMAG